MVEQRAATPESRSSGARVWALTLAFAGGLILWWALMTGTAHAAETPVPGSGQAAPLLDHAASATQTVTHVVTKPVARTVTRPATEQVRQAVRQTVAKTVTREQARTATSAHTRARSAARAVIHGEPVAYVAPVAPAHRAIEDHTPTQPGVDQSVTTETQPLDGNAADGTPPAPAPTRSGTSAGGGTGPSVGLLVGYTRASGLLSPTTHSAVRQLAPPAEPAYPPGSSPD